MWHPWTETFDIRVYYEDTDFSGRVYHVSYLRFLERGRTEWFCLRWREHREIAGSSGVVFAVRNLRIDYLAPALLDDLLRVETQVTGFRGASIDFLCSGSFAAGKNSPLRRCSLRQFATVNHRGSRIPCAG